MESVSIPPAPWEQAIRWEPTTIDSGRSRFVDRRSAVLRGDSSVRRALGIADCLGVAGAVLITAQIAGAAVQPIPLIGLFVAVLALAKLMRLYDRDAQLLHKNTLDEYPKLIALATTLSLILSVGDQAFTSPALDGAEIGITWALFASLIPTTRSLARRFWRDRVAPERCLYLGNPSDAAVLQVHLTATSATEAKIVGAIDVRRARRAGDRHYLTQIAPLALEHGVDRAILASEVSGSVDALELVQRLRSAGLKVSAEPDTSQLITAPLEVDRLGGAALLGVPPFEASISTRVVKRSFDIAVTVTALLLTLPVFALTALAIRLDSRGPIIYRQPRAGRSGTTFTIYKFRSMFDDADSHKDQLRTAAHEAGLFKLADDPRITRVGRWIRKLAIDELPQLWNVLRGDMALVGPRPLPLDEDAKIEDWGRQRLDGVRPGMTGPWQILTGPGRIPLHDMVRLDLHYVATWSLWSDLRILMLTVGHVFARRGH